MGIGSPRLHRIGACGVLVLAAWLLPARAAHADGLPLPAAPSTVAAVVTDATATVADATADVTEPAAPLTAPLLETGSRAVAATAAPAAARVAHVTAPAVRHVARRMPAAARPAVRRVTSLDVVRKVVDTVTAPRASVPAAPAAPAESSPGAAAGPRPAQAATAAPAGRPRLHARPVDGVDGVALPHVAVLERVAGLKTTLSPRPWPAIAPLRLFAPPPQGPAARDAAGAAAGVVDAPSRFRFAFHRLDAPAPTPVVRLQGVVLLLELERPG